jgi:hypothetical protein
LDPEVIKILSLREDLASLRHIYLGSFFLDPEDSRKLSKEVIWNFVKGKGLLSFSIEKKKKRVCLKA